MKKIILTLAIVALSTAFASAQDMSVATETAKGANEALVAKDYAAALAGFKEALTQAEACGEDGAELVETCKGVIPSIILSIAKGEIKDAEYDKGLATLAEAIEAATKYGADDVLEDANVLIPQVKKQKANSLFSAKDFAAAAEAFKELVEADPTDGVSALRLGMALNSTGDKDGAVAALEAAAANGQEANAKKQLSNIFLKDGQALLKEKKFKEALEALMKSNGYVESANAYKLAVNCASNLKDYKAAVEYSQKYLDLSPNAQDAEQVKKNIEAFKALIK